MDNTDNLEMEEACATLILCLSCQRQCAIRKGVQVNCARGIHLRPATLIKEKVIELFKDDDPEGKIFLCLLSVRRTDASNALEIIRLQAGQGSVVIVSADDIKYAPAVKEVVKTIESLPNFEPD